MVHRRSRTARKAAGGRSVQVVMTQSYPYQGQTFAPAGPNPSDLIGIFVVFFLVALCVHLFLVFKVAQEARAAGVPATGWVLVTLMAPVVGYIAWRLSQSGGPYGRGPMGPRGS
jgi:hypothetical protein